MCGSILPPLKAGLALNHNSYKLFDSEQHNGEVLPMPCLEYFVLR